MIKPFASRPSVGGFFFWEDGEIYREASYLQFPFHRKELGGGDPPRSAPPPSRGEQPESNPLPPYTPMGEPQQQMVRYAPAGQRGARGCALAQSQRAVYGPSGAAEVPMAVPAHG